MEVRGLPGTPEIIVLGLLAASASVWGLIASGWRRRDELLPFEPREPVRWHASTLCLVAGWIAISALNRIGGAMADRAEPPSAEDLFQTSLTNLGMLTGLLVVLLVMLSVQSPRGLGDYGITARGFGRQARIAAAGFLASVLPVCLLILAMFPFRSPETQHSLLKLLRELPGWKTVTVVALLAVALAPLLEELLYRVVIQSWLVARLGAGWGIGITALLFAAAHGWRDGVPLVPLAAILGILYHRTHRYFAVVLLHALFNGTMLLLQALGRG